MQYLACGKAVIATSLPGMIAVIPDEQQGVVYTNNADDMVREIVSLLKSTERRQKLESNGLNYAIRVHSHDKIAHQLEASLEEVIKEKRNGESPQRV